MPNESQNLMSFLGSMTSRQLKDLEGLIKKTRTAGMDKFEKARKACIDGYFAAIKIHHDTHVNPDYTYEFQEFPKVLYTVLETNDGPQMASMQFESAEDAAELGPEWCANPGLAQKYFDAQNPTEPMAEVKRRGRPPLNRTGETAHA
jgi:hypothetical protein